MHAKSVAILLLAQLLAACLAEVGGGEEDDWTAEAQSAGPGVDRRFELATRECSAAQEAASPQCPPGDETCLCGRLFDRLNTPAGSPGNPRGKLIVLGGARYRAQVEAAGNAVAHTVNSMNQCRGHDRFSWSACTGKERARQIMEDATVAWGGAPPEWFLLNELVSAFHRDDETGVRYREWVVNLVRALHDEHGRSVVVFTWFRPIGTPFRWAWTQIGKVAHVGVEMYLSAREIRDAGFREDWCEGQYLDWRKRFVANGVPASRVILTEHFGETAEVYKGRAVGWGRAGLKDADWRRALALRTRAARDVAFAGYASYGWAGNRVQASEEDRLAHADLYLKVRLAGVPTTVAVSSSLSLPVAADLPGPAAEPEAALEP